MSYQSLQEFLHTLLKPSLQSLNYLDQQGSDLTSVLLDIMAIILNRLPARYVVTGKGWIMTKIKETEVQFQADILREMVRAIEIVKTNPR